MSLHAGIVHDRLAEVELPVASVRQVLSNVFVIVWAEGATTEQEVQGEAILASLINTPTPRLAELVAVFTFPGNALYASVVAKVAQCGFVTQDHWSNFKLLIRSGGSVEAVGQGIQYLKFLMDQDNHPPSQGDIDGWNALVDEYHLPAGCRW